MRASSTGLTLAILSAASFGTSGTFATALMAAGWSPGAAVTTRIGAAALLLTGPALMQLRGRWFLLRRSLPAVAVYGLLAVAGCQLFYFNAVEHLSVGVALLLEYSGTLLVVLWVWLRHGSAPRRLTLVGGALALGGLVLVLDLVGAQQVSLVGVLWGLGAAAGLAFYFVLSAHTGQPSEHRGERQRASARPGRDLSALPPTVVAWAGMAVGAATLLVAGAAGVVTLRASTQDADFAGHRTSWVIPIIGLSLLAAVIAYSSGIGAARRLGARLASFVGLAEVLFAVLFAWAFLNQEPTGLQLAGGAFVVAGVALVKADEREVAAASGPEPVPAL